jgi:serine phosphatase RsbU (regulator of sigma subunit)
MIAFKSKSFNSSHLFTIVLFLLLAFRNIAQTKNKLDSIFQLIRQEKTDSAKIRHYVTLCEICPYSENLKYGQLGFDFLQKLIENGTKEFSREELFKKQIYFLEIKAVYYENRIEYFEQIELRKKMITLAEKAKDTLILEQKYVELANNLQNAGQADAAFDILIARLKKYENISKKFRAFYLGNIGEFYYNNHNNLKALTYYEMALPYYLENKKIAQASQILERISEQYDLLGEKEKAIRSCLQNLEMISKSKDEINTTNILYRLANLYINKNNFKKAEEIINRMKERAEAKKDSSDLATVYLVKANFFEKKKDKKKEEECLMICIKIHEKQNDSSNLAYRLSGISVFYLDNGMYQKSIDAAERGLEIAKKLKEIDDQKEFWQLLYISYKKINKHKDALNTFENFKKMEDSLKNYLNQSTIEQREHILEFEKKENNAKSEQEKKDILITKEREKEKITRNALTTGIALIFLLVIFIYRGYRIKISANKSLSEQNKWISAQKEKTEEQKNLIEQKQKEILESITYAKRLQEAILPPVSILQENTKEHFILYQPKDIVAGDFYWAEKIENNFFIAAADSTGHGVPGAMVSVVCSTALNRSVKEFGLKETGKILDKTREIVVDTLAKNNNSVKDGMDISLLCIDNKNKKINWSGANNPIWYVQENKFYEIKADKQPIGKTEHEKPFTTHEIEWKEGNTFYLFTDGFADQFGGPKGKKFKYKQMEELLMSEHQSTLSRQVSVFEKKFSEWKGNLEQVDDVCVIALKV